MRGALLGEQGGRCALLRAGDLTLRDSSRPHTLVLAPEGPDARALVLQFPRSLLPLPERNVRDLADPLLDSTCQCARTEDLCAELKDRAGPRHAPLPQGPGTSAPAAAALTDCTGVSPEARTPPGRWYPAPWPFRHPTARADRIGERPA
ncbi:hypothetical protein [Streptomyces sp. NPDC048172]|uniref:hypothetical protein n=1 Tax=Streptomyces sp. NPDC048172 TaxID=3365505 RepID=UPI00370FB654